MKIKCPHPHDRFQRALRGATYEHASQTIAAGCCSVGGVCVDGVNIGIWVSTNSELWGLELQKCCDFGSFAEFEILWAARGGNRNKLPRPTSATMAIISVPSFSSIMD